MVLVPRILQNTSNVNTECSEKPKQPYSLCNQPLEALMYIYFIVFNWLCLVEIVQYMVASLREQPQEHHYTAETKVTLIKQIIVSSTPFCCWGKQIFKKTLPRGISNSLCLGVTTWGRVLAGNGGMSKNV